MKAILLSIKPEWVVKILNGEKTIEIRKKFPKDYVGWVYIYCTKGKPELSFVDCLHYDLLEVASTIANGKVVARFWCEDIEYCEDTSILNDEEYDLTDSCLTAKQIQDYGKSVYAIHISKLEVFDKPRELTSFGKYCSLNEIIKGVISPQTIGTELTKAPQNYCFVESEN